MAHHLGNDFLVSVFELFKIEQHAVHGLLSDVQHTFRELERRVETIRTERKTQLKKIEDLLLQDTVLARIRRVFQEPKIIFVGQTNAGKSSLINELLETTVVKADDVPCTSRIVELKYGDNENPVIDIYNKKGEWIETKYSEKSYISSGIANLPDSDKDNVELIGSKVVARVKNDFLRSGVTLVDSPGKNENKELDKMIEDHMKSILPLVVYVIDGRNMLSKQDNEDIKSLRNTLPEGNIFFVVTKCDTSDDSDSEDDGETEFDALQPTTLEIEIKHGIYNKLTDPGPDPNAPTNILEAKPIDKCTTYHALSSRRVKQYRWAQNKLTRTNEDEKTLREYERFMRDFQRFKSCLLHFAETQLLKFVIESCGKLEESLSACLDYFIETNNTLFENKEKTENNFVVVEKEANKLKKIQLTTICEDKSSVKAAVTRVLNNKQAIVVDFAKTYVFEVPPDFFIEADTLKNMFLNDVFRLIGELIRDELLQKDSPLLKSFNDLQIKAREIQEAVGDGNDTNNALQQMFIGYCQIDISETDLTFSCWRRLFNFLKSFFRSIFRGSQFALSVSMDIVLGSSSYAKFCEEIEKCFGAMKRKDLAKDILHGINPEELAQEIIQFLTSFVEEGHTQFIKQLTGLRVLFNEGCVLGDCELIRQMAPPVAKLLMTAWNIQDRLRYRNIVYGKVLGRGGRASVHECNIIAPNGQSCAIKQLKVPAREMETVGMKIHYARMLKHQNILEVLGVMHDYTGEDEYTVSIVMPRMKGDLTAILPTIPSLKERLIIGLKVGHALEYTHGQKMPHWDIKCGNILVADTGEVKISDLGLYKPIIIGGSFESMPVFLAPEVIQPNSEKADVYSFGVLLWYVYEGQGRSPVYVQACLGLKDVLKSIVSGSRPEKLPDMREDCWDLMQRCWVADPSSRPTIAAVNIQLKEIIDKIA